jgi:hypothetical protein
LNVWSLLVCSDTLSSKWVNIPGRIWLDGTGDFEVPVTFANGTVKFILNPYGSNSPGADNLLTRSPLFLQPSSYLKK